MIWQIVDGADGRVLWSGFSKEEADRWLRAYPPRFFVRRLETTPEEEARLKAADEAYEAELQAALDADMDVRSSKT